MGGGGAQPDNITEAKVATTTKTNIFFIFPSPENWYLIVAAVLWSFGYVL